MALFEQFPYTNFHEMNMDWLLQRVKALEIIASDVADEFVVFRESGGSYTKIVGKTASELYADISAGKKVQGMIIGSNKIEYACEVNAIKIMGKASVNFKLAPDISTSITPDQLTVKYGRQVSLTQAVPSDTIAYTETSEEVATV